MEIDYTSADIEIKRQESRNEMPPTTYFSARKRNRGPGSRCFRVHSWRSPNSRCIVYRAVEFRLVEHPHDRLIIVTARTQTIRRATCFALVRVNCTRLVDDDRIPCLKKVRAYQNINREISLNIIKISLLAVFRVICIRIWSTLKQPVQTHFVSHETQRNCQTRSLIVRSQRNDVFSRSQCKKQQRPRHGSKTPCTVEPQKEEVRGTLLRSSRLREQADKKETHGRGPEINDAHA